MIARHKKSVATLLIGIAIGCASTPKAPPIIGPERIPGGSQYPQFEIPANIRDVPVGHLDFQVWVDAEGNPEPDTIRISGAGSRENEMIIRQWLLASRFRPATQAGRPVRGLFMMSARTRIEVR